MLHNMYVGSSTPYSVLCWYVCAPYSLHNSWPRTSALEILGCESQGSERSRSWFQLELGIFESIVSASNLSPNLARNLVLSLSRY